MKAGAIHISVALTLLATAAQTQWTIQDSHTTASLRGIDNVGNGIAWASGANGTVLRTEDGGYVWQLCAIPPGAEKLDFRGIQAFDANTAIVMSSGKGGLSRLYKTTDGCQTWKLIFTNPDKDGFWDAVGATSQHVYKGKPASIDGWIFGDPVDGHFRIYDFFDGYLISAVRKPWHEVWLRKNEDQTLKADPASNGAFAASNSSFFTVPWERQPIDGKDVHKGTVWPFSQLFITGGKGGAHIYTAIPTEGDVWEPTKWRSSPLPLGENIESSGAFAVALAANHKAGVIVGGDYLKPDDNTKNAAYYSVDKDAWQTPQTPPHGFRSAIAYDPQQKLWITVGPNGTDISTDDGRNWRALKPSPTDPPDADKNWNALSLPYVVGPNGRIGKLRPISLNNQPSTKR